MRILTIGDIHGCLGMLDALLDVVQPQKDDLLVTLGDYVDRGPNSAGVLDRLIALSTQTGLVPLRGNHEEMMLAARFGYEPHRAWFMAGGDRTMASYGSRNMPLREIPAEHWQFLEDTCVDYSESDSHLFVHGGVEPYLPLDRQSLDILHWQTFKHPFPHRSGKVMVCGHTPQPSGLPRNLGHAVCIDTYAFGGGFLTCLETLSGQFWQADQEGRVRQGQLDDLLES